MTSGNGTNDDDDALYRPPWDSAAPTTTTTPLTTTTGPTTPTTTLWPYFNAITTMTPEERVVYDRQFFLLKVKIPS